MIIMILMQRVLQIKLTPDANQSEALDATMQRFNAACNWVSERAFERQLANRFKLHKLFYYDVRTTFGLSAQFTCLVFARVAAALRRDKRIKPTFKPRASLPYDVHLLRFLNLHEVSLLTLAGRIRVGMVMGQYQEGLFEHVKTVAELVYRDGTYYLMAVIEQVDEPPVTPDDFLGVDMGIVNIATDSDGEVHSGKPLAAVRIRYGRLRTRLQRAAAMAATRMTRKRIHRKLKRTRRRESCFARDVNHVISKRLVAKAEGTDRGIALEDLKGIRDRTRFRKRQRGLMSSWAFDQLRHFTEYKATLAGVLVLVVNPRDTSRECSACGFIAKSNRQSQASFRCGKCGHTTNADTNAALNIRRRAVVNLPMVPAFY